MTPLGLLNAMAETLRLQHIAGVEVHRDKWLIAEGEVVAHVHRDCVVITSVLDGVDHGAELAPKMRRQPTDDPDQPATLAAEVIARLLMRRRERVRFVLWTTAKRLAPQGYVGLFHVEPFAEVTKVTWVGDRDSSSSTRRAALRAAETDLQQAGYPAQWIPGLDWIRIVSLEVVDADAPKTALDGGESEPAEETLVDVMRDAAE